MTKLSRRKRLQKREKERLEKDSIYLHDQLEIVANDPNLTLGCDHGKYWQKRLNRLRSRARGRKRLFLIEKQREQDLISAKPFHDFLDENKELLEKLIPE